ncbi:MAG: hypothetical protein WBA01_17600 [Phormidesmis sp.]
MARKVTPLYAETITLLKLWSLDETPASKSNFVPSGTSAYSRALHQLVEEGFLVQTPKNKRTNVYAITEGGQQKLSAGLENDDFAFSAIAGPKVTNALLKWFRQNQPAVRDVDQTVAVASDNDKYDSASPAIGSYEEFTKTALKTYDQLNQDYNLDDLVPIYRIRREIGDRISRHNFNEWLLEVQANDLVQLTGGELPNVTADQLEDSVAIPGGGTRFYVKRLQPA